MYLEFIKNPIFIGILSATITLLYLLWDKNKNLKNKKKKIDVRDVNLLIPIIVGLVSCILAYAYFYMSDNVCVPINLNHEGGTMPNIPHQQLNNNAATNLQFGTGAVALPIPNIKQGDSVTSLHLVTKGNITMPTKPLDTKQLPDVFIDLY